MGWLKTFAGTPFSDLWLPTVLIGLGLVAVLGLHWLWLQWRVKHLESMSQAAVLNAAAQADALRSGAFRSPATVNQFESLSDIHALTAQKQAVYIEDLPLTDDHTVGVHRFAVSNAASDATQAQQLHQRIEPSFAKPADAHLQQQPHIKHVSADAWVTSSADNAVMGRHTNDDANNNAHDLDADESSVFYNPRAEFAQNERQRTAIAVHPQLHYQTKFTWSDANSKHVMADVLKSNPWQGNLPVVWSVDKHDENSLIAAWQLVNRRELATAAQAETFKHWCETLASLGGAIKCDYLDTNTWESCLDEAHSLLIGLDSVIVLKISVPLVQLDLFAQSLLAARFTQSQEHWIYPDSSTNIASASVCLERLWQQNKQATQSSNAPAVADTTVDAGATVVAVVSDNNETANNNEISNNNETSNNNAVFQLIIDIPHLDSLEARKIYMRLRAVARSSAAIIQSAQGAHLSEGMLDRYSRELLLKQEALSQASLLPGSKIAQDMFKPRLRISSDLMF